MGPQLLEVAHDVAGDALQPGAGRLQAVSGDAEYPPPPDTVKVVVGHGDIDLVPAAVPGAVVDERELEREGTSK